MSTRVMFLGFNENDFIETIIKEYPNYRNWILKEFEDNIDGYDISLLEFIDQNSMIDNLSEIDERINSLLINSFFNYLEFGKTKKKEKYGIEPTPRFF